MQILVSTVVLGGAAAGLSACGQQGPLYLPTEPAAANRATLPQTLLPSAAVKTTQTEAQVFPSAARAPANAASATTPVPQ